MLRFGLNGGGKRLPPAANGTESRPSPLATGFVDAAKWLRSRRFLVRRGKNREGPSKEGQVPRRKPDRETKAVRFVLGPRPLALGFHSAPARLMS